MASPLRFDGLVLIIDDVEDNREVYTQFLEFNGIRVVTAESGEAGLAVARTQRPNVIILDLGMPGMDGWEVARRLKSSALTKRIPVIALTGHAFEESRKRAAEAGVDIYLVKPCLPDNLLAEIRPFLSTRTSA